MEELRTSQYNEINVSKQLRLFFGICLGLFFFILFYDPFSLKIPDYNDKILLISGIAGVAFFSMSLFLIILPWLFPDLRPESNKRISLFFFPQLYIWIFCSVGLVFYLHYVGLVSLNMFMVFKISLLCLIPSIVLRIENHYYWLNKQIRILNDKNIKLASQLMNSEVKLKQTETFISENKSEKISLPLDDIIIIKSADNYVEMIFREKEDVNKKLIRNTLRNIESQLNNYPYFVRCHRSAIVNLKQVVKLTHSYKGYRLTIPDFPEEIPVSRQYLMKVRTALDQQ